MTEADPCQAAEFVGSGVLSKTFFTVLLLTGSVRESETAVLESVECLDLDDDMPGEKLFRRALKSAIARARKIAEQRPGDFDNALSLLPPELRRVLRLPADLRHCFALRLLAGLPGSVCALMLNLQVDQVEDATEIAAQQLARLSDSE